jgi:hypothetical protein
MPLFAEVAARRDGVVSFLSIRGRRSKDQRLTRLLRSAAIRKAPKIQRREEIGALTVGDGARRQARVSLFVLRQAMERAAGSALPN